MTEDIRYYSEEDFDWNGELAHLTQIPLTRWIEKLPEQTDECLATALLERSRHADILPISQLPDGPSQKQIDLLTLMLLVSVSLLVAGPGYWQGFAAKIWQHNDSFSPWRVGFKHLFIGAYEFRPDGAATHQEIFHDRWAIWWTSQAFVLIGVVYLTRRMRDWETLTLGFVPTFFLVAPTYYYYVMLVIPLLFFCGRANRPECVMGILWLLVSSSIAYVVHDSIGRELQLFYVLSLMVFGVCVLMGLSALLQTVRWRKRVEEPTLCQVAAP